MFNIHITEDAVEHRKEHEGGTTTYLTPDEAVGQIVEFEPPGRMGKQVWQIQSVNLDEEVTVLTDVITGQEYHATEGFLHPSYKMFSLVEPGKEYSVEWVETMRGNGEWVQTTPEVPENQHRNANTYYGHYHGHERRRVVEKTYKFIPANLVEKEIKKTPESLEVYYSDDIENLEEVLNQIDDSNAADYTTVGHIYTNSDSEIIWFDIEHQYRRNNASYAFQMLDTTLSDMMPDISKQ